ncbi:GNAT family N-acetyltransferase [Nocardia thailandica]|uniref:GNAT family N-acetyltransferase n=1 Tax=Nocardia thailandica TaxID=257275 RepID=A0ABW6PNC0_9NOCA|nr:GNAT family protein [Nocardia thailandica]
MHSIGRIVELRVLTEGDVEALTEAATEARSSYTYAHVPDTAEAMGRWVAEALDAYDDGRQLPLVISRADTGEVIGSTRFHLESWPWPGGKTGSGGPDAVEIGSTWLAHSAQRTGANSEAKLLMLEHAFDRWSVRRVRFRTDVRNTASRKAIEALGAHFDGILRGDYPGPDGEARDSAYYSILAREWPAIRRRLADKISR